MCKVKLSREKIIFGSLLTLSLAISGLAILLLGKNIVLAGSNNATSAPNAQILNITDYDISEFFYYRQEGKSSWYGRRFHKRRTASGELFDMNRLTAAHRYLPFGTIVRVKNVENDNVLLVRITDRGPFVYSKVIDLSYYSAKLLGAIGNPFVEIEALVPKEDVELDLSENYYFGYSFDYPLVCLPESKIKFINEFDNFEDAVEYYRIAQNMYPDTFVYLFVPMNQTYKNIKFWDGEKYFVGFFEQPQKVVKNNFVQKNDQQ